MLSAILSPFSVELTGQLPVITVHPRKCLAAKKVQSQQGISRQTEFMHLEVMQLDMHLCKVYFNLICKETRTNRNDSISS